jgi:radical SAM-linked protein
VYHQAINVISEALQDQTLIVSIEKDAIIMSRYLIKFRKEGHMKYISHLDMMRLFHRTFKIAGIYLSFSNGFNPHPKFSIAQPLSLGYLSSGEYAEFETEGALDPDSTSERLNALLPIGISIINCREMDHHDKTLASIVESAAYNAELIFNDDFNTKPFDTYILQDNINIQKLNRKSGKTATLDLKPLIHSLNVSIDGKTIRLCMTIKTGSTANLNPETLINAFLEFYELDQLEHRRIIIRKELFYLRKGMPYALSESQYEPPIIT